MSKFIKICEQDGAIGGWVAFIISIILVVFAVVTPPPGIIDGSILTAVGELLAFAVIFRLPNMIKSIKDGKSITYHHNNTDVTISSEKDDKPDCHCSETVDNQTNTSNVDNI